MGLVEETIVHHPHLPSSFNAEALIPQPLGVLAADSFQMNSSLRIVLG
jgi:hypothetical protein